MPEILLIQPPIEDFYLTAKRTFPYGLACIASALRQAGFSVAILDSLATGKSRPLDRPPEMAYLEPFFGRADQSPFALFHQYRHFGYSYQYIAGRAKSSGAFLIGISSLFTAYSRCALDTAARVKLACPGATIVLGGHHPTALPREVLAHPAVDFVLRGDGEIGMPLLAAALKKGTDPDSIPGLARRDETGGLRCNPPAVIADLNQMPLPAFDLINWRHYRRKYGGSLALATGRGCTQRCTYCAVNAATYHGFRQKSVQHVMAEMASAETNADLTFIDFEDENLSADRQWFTRLLEAIIRRNSGRTGHLKPELRAMNGLFAPTLDAPIVTRMAAAGFKTLNLALITTDTGQLRRFNRPPITDDLDRVLALARLNDLTAVAYLIAAGPHQDPVTTISDLLFLAQRPVLAGLSVFYPAPGSPDYQWCRQNDLLPLQEGLLRATALPLVHNCDRTQSVTLMRLARLLNYMKNLLDRGMRLPSPQRLSGGTAGIEDRDHIGRLLLAAFLRDGTILGRDTDGTIYPHRVDQTLVNAFLAGIKNTGVHGVNG